ncbi:tRNA (adenosine(37)-N6)-threonylcarbamoyltransferase complex ATPase subunit type 1 TsaE [soil metagenome]
MHAVSTRSKQPDDTRKMARALASWLVAGDVILLKGGLAAGKTLFVSALAQALGATDPVTSPTFSLVHIYPTPLGDLIHVDAYRLETLAEFRDLGLDELAEAGVLAIEWGGLVETDYPAALEIEISEAGGDEARDIRLSSRSERWAPVLATLAGVIA